MVATILEYAIGHTAFTAQTEKKTIPKCECILNYYAVAVWPFVNACAEQIA